MPRNRITVTANPADFNAIVGSVGEPQVADIPTFDVDEPHSTTPMPVRNVLTDLIVNGEREAWGFEQPRNTRRKKPQWVNRYVPISHDGNLFVKYTEELDSRHMSCVICNLDAKTTTYLTADDVVVMRDALNTILGDSNG